MFYLTTHSIHFIYGYMASEITNKYHTHISPLYTAVQLILLIILYN